VWHCGFSVNIATGAASLLRQLAAAAFTAGVNARPHSFLLSHVS